jgi:EmrB/QacA subfamily drug resistance transporter
VTTESVAVPVPQERTPLKQWLMLLLLGMGLAIVIVDVTIVNVAIPSIRREFNASFNDIEWVTSIYALVYAALIVTWGRLADQLGRKRIFIAGVITFVVSSILAGSAPNMGLLILARAFQGVGAAMTSPATLSIISAEFTGRMRGVAFGIWGAIAGAAAAIGPLLGGWLTTNASWRWAFYVNLPIGVVAVIGSFWLLRESRESARRITFDIPGIFLIALGIGGIVFGLIEGQAHGWWRPTQPFAVGGWTWPLANLSITPVSFVIGTLSLLAFVIWENRLNKRGADPLFDFSLLRFRSFRFGLLTVAIVALGEFGIIFVLSIYLQSVRNLTAFQTGLTFLPFALTTLVVAPMAGILSARWGPKWVVTAGMLLEALSIFLVSRVLRVDTPGGLVTLVLMLYGAGVGLAIAQLTNVVLSEVPRDRLGAGSGATNTIRQVGAALGIAILGTILTTQITATARVDLAASKVIPPFVQTAIINSFEQGNVGEGQDTVTGAPAGSENTPAGKEISRIIQGSFVSGARASADAAAIFVFLGALSSLFIPNPPKRKMAGAPAGH